MRSEQLSEQARPTRGPGGGQLEEETNPRASKCRQGDKESKALRVVGAYKKK